MRTVTRHKEQKTSWVVRTFNTGDQPCRLSLIPLLPSSPPSLSTNKPPRAPRPSHVEARIRMYLAAVTDPETGRTNPDREQRVLRVMAL
jgi:hypothetical protein